MAYSLSYALDLGTSGLTLKAALVSAGTIHAVFRDITTTFYADGQGGYEFVTAAIPDGSRGMMVFYTGTLGAASDFSGVVIYSRGSVNPEEVAPTSEEVALAVWTEELPGSYVEGTAGYLIGNPPAAGADMASFISEITEREHYFTTLHEKTIPSSFKHTPADNKPTPPDYPDSLDEGAQAEVVAWRMAGSNPDSGSDDYPTDTDAVGYVEDAIAYQAAIRAWQIADKEARIAQYDWLRCDAAIWNKPTMSASADDAGTGSDPPPADLPPTPIHGSPP